MADWILPCQWTLGIHFLDCLTHPCAPPTDNTELIMTSRRAVLSLFLLRLYCVMKFNACHTDLSLTRTFYEAMTPTQQAVHTQSLSILKPAVTLFYQWSTHLIVSTTKQSVLWANSADFPATKKTHTTTFCHWLEFFYCSWKAATWAIIQALLSERGHTTQNIHVAIVARVSLVAVEPSHVTPATSGHTTNVLECYQTTQTTNSAAAMANFHNCAITIHCTHSRLLMTAITQLSSRKVTIFCLKT